MSRTLFKAHATIGPTLRQVTVTQQDKLQLLHELLYLDASTLGMLPVKKADRLQTFTSLLGLFLETFSL